jgi:hypothetical protein
MYSNFFVSLMQILTFIGVKNYFEFSKLNFLSQLGIVNVTFHANKCKDQYQKNYEIALDMYMNDFMDSRISFIFLRSQRARF